MHGVWGKDNYQMRQDPHPHLIALISPPLLLDRWNEVTDLIEEGLLAPKEVETIWERLPKVSVTQEESGETSTSIDLQGFLEFDRQVTSGSMLWSAVQW